MACACLVAAASLLAGCSGPVPAASGTPTVGTAPATASAAVGSAATPSSSPASGSVAPPSATPPAASPSSGPDDRAAASLTATAYLEDLIGGRYPLAWARLAPASQAFWGSLEAYATERAAFYRTAGPQYVLSQPDSSAAALAEWLPTGFDGERQRASVIQLEYVRISGPAGFSVLVVAPDAAGTWRIWIAR